MKSNILDDIPENIKDCPVLKDKLDTLTPEQLKDLKVQYENVIKPKIEKDKATANGKGEDKKTYKRHPRLKEFQNQQGSCPYMNMKLIEPADESFPFGYKLRYKSRYDFILKFRGKMPIKEFREKRKIFNSYPPFLLHTLFHGNHADKVRQADFGNAFFIFDDLKQEGNLYYEDKNYYQAINLYEQAYSIFQWLEMKDKKKKEDLLKILDLNPIVDDDVYRDEKDLKGDDCEIDTRLSAINNILLNLSCAYMHLAHYEEALHCCDEILRLTNLSVEGYYRRSQIRTYNLKSTYADLELALLDIEKSIEKKPQEKKYIQHKEIIIKRQKEKLDDDLKFITRLVNSAKRSLDFKLTHKSNHQLPPNFEVPNEIKIMKVMKKKYSDAMEFFRDTENLEQIAICVKDFQDYAKNYYRMMKFYKFNAKRLEPSVLDSVNMDIRILLNDENIIKEIETIKVREALALFGEGHINFELFKYAMKIVNKEEKKEREKIESRMKILNDKAKIVNNPLVTKRNFLVFVIGFIIAIFIWYWGFKNKGFQFAVNLLPWFKKGN